MCFNCYDIVKMIRRQLPCMLFLLLMCGLSSCVHKDLYMDTDEPVKMKVVFDWRYAPDANPESMALYLFPTDGGTPLRYIFTGREGGEIHLPFGVYDAVCVNADNTDWAELEAMDTPEAARVRVEETSSLSPYSELARVLVSRPESDDGNQLVDVPHATWTSGVKTFDARFDGTDKTLVLYPEDRLCHYTVDIYDVEGLDDNNGSDTRSGSSVMASLSNMTDGVKIFSGEKLTNLRAIPFILQKGDTTGSLHSEFDTFGENGDLAPVHHLSLYTKMDDGSWTVQTKDVTVQVHQAPDPKHVHIILRGAVLPKTSEGGAGFTVDVNGWESEYYEMKM